MAPGLFWTTLQVSGGQLPHKVQHGREESAFGRSDQPVELAPVYVRLASRESSYISG